MQNINFHLAYLLTKHECVIIPDFGALVVFRNLSEKSKESGIFCPPKNTLGFNSEIKHNDGLLANSLVKEKNSTYKESCAQIQEFSNQLKLSLSANNPVEIDWIGTFFLSPENKIIFKPASNLSCNVDNYGFTNFYFPLLAEIQDPVHVESTPEEKALEPATVPLREKVITYTGSIAAAIAALFLIISPLDNTLDGVISQNAGMAPIHTIQLSQPSRIQEEPEIEPETPEILQESIINAEPEVEVNPVKEEVPEIKTEIKEETPKETKEEIRELVNQRYYFIVIASFPAKDIAEKMVKRFKNEGFKDASIISDEGKHRIYINHFAKKSDAEVFLKEFRQNNPKYAKSWLLGQRATL